MKKILAFFAIALLLLDGCVTSPKGTPTQPIVNKFGNPESPQKALVIGNANYQYRQLVNPTNDANDVAGVLEEMGFYVLVATNINLKDMKKLIASFNKTLTGSDVALFYFSGHGAGLETDGKNADGKNYLFPTDNKNIGGDLNVSNRAIRTDMILKAMKNGNRDGVNILILDACRDEKPPYEGSSRTRARGMIKTSSVNGTVQAYATAFGKIASDNPKEDNGLYTKYLLKTLRIAKVKPIGIEQILIKVSQLVSKASNGMQNPDHDYAVDGGKLCLGFKDCREAIQ